MTELYPDPDQEFPGFSIDLSTEEDPYLIIEAVKSELAERGELRGVIMRYENGKITTAHFWTKEDV